MNAGRDEIAAYQRSNSCTRLSRGTRSACQAKKGGISPALLALGLDERRAKQVLRISFARETSAAEVRASVDALCAALGELRGRP